VNYIIRPAAKDDIIRQYRYYLVDQDVPELANRFLRAVEETIEKLIAMPKMGSPKDFGNAALRELRSWPVQGFEDVRIYYLAEVERLRVIRILHGKRNLSRIFKRDWADD